MNNSDTLQSRILSAASKPDDYRIYRAALEWDLTDPIVIESRKDVKSEIRWRDRVEPFNHQVSNLITFCRRLPVTLLADDVGLGKTISAGLIMSELIARARLSKALIVAPKILGPQWVEELKTKFDITAKIAKGKELLSVDPGEIGAVVTTYHSAREYLEKLPADRFEMLILDEAHKLRNLYGTEKAPQVALKFKKALEERRFRFVLMLTATPIQNRLWDLYSLVDLLTAARGHKNPFGSDGQFARRFIADNRENARRLKPESTQEFRSIVYGYMSRVRRGDAKLHFPDRKVQLHRVDPTAQEFELIRVVGKGVEKLNRLAQISILQALTSSPEALRAQLNNMERNRTIPPDFAAAVRSVVGSMTTSAKLIGLDGLIKRLKRENPNRWRLVIFTSRRETQTTIQVFLESHGLSVGVINGSSGARNQETIANFKSNPPKCRVIVSTEAGSEGVNLQVANVLVNYDLPWNPMIVEQRIGRIQRLASEHASVGIFNITLRGTFEEHIVGRLMEKLQMSTSAIGDIESLLEGSGVGDDEGDDFEEKIRKLVVEALKGADVEASTQMMVDSISEAKAKLEREEKQIDGMLGGGEGQGYVGPRAPTLPSPHRSMSVSEFTLQALETLGAKVSRQGADLFHVEDEQGRESIRFEEKANEIVSSTLHAAGSPAFLKLVQRLVASGVHRVVDQDGDLRARTEDVARAWASDFGGQVERIQIDGARRQFAGEALVRARATVAHDSYERLIEVRCVPGDSGAFTRQALSPTPRIIEQAEAIGLDSAMIVAVARQDAALSEFARFYLERRAQEMTAAGGDLRRKKKMEDDFTPRFIFALVGAEGRLHREVRVQVSYRIKGGDVYASRLSLAPSTSTIIEAPAFGVCAVTRRSVPDVVLGQCALTHAMALRHLLVKSDHSERLALPEHIVICEQSGGRLISDEAETSSVTGRLIAKRLLKTSTISGQRAEAEHFGQCAFSGIDALRSELRVSAISGKLFHPDAAERSAVSSRVGHRSEFIACEETRQPIAASEAESCSATGRKVHPAILQACEKTGARVVPSELAACEVSGRRVLKKFLKASAISGQRAEAEHFGQCAFSGVEALQSELRVSAISGKLFHPDAAERSAVSSRVGHRSEFIACEETRQPIAASEAESCSATGRKVHPAILQVCEKTGVRVISSELASCAVSGRRVLKKLLKVSALSGQRAEAEHFGQCAFSGVEALRSELRVSEISGKLFRPDVAERSAVSSRIGHRSEFIACEETRRPIVASEAESCSATGRKVHPGILRACEETGARVIPSELASCAVSGRRVLKKLLTESSISGAALLEKEAIRSAFGKFCAPVEAKTCLWSGRPHHPDDVRRCELTGIDIHFKYATSTDAPRLEPLMRLLDGGARNADLQESWEKIAEREVQAMGKGRCSVEAAILSPNGEHLAVSTKVTTFLGLRTQLTGFVFANGNKLIVGRIAQGTRDEAGWRPAAGR